MVVLRTFIVTIENLVSKDIIYIADSKLKSTLVLLNLAELCADDRYSWY